ncbi:Biotin-requiring enzyme [Abditibacterium utsteinense]|uniref:Biotin-requiring enzyme n=1 Tax=Abditibacterium utsteinense TaxID=1960156 RepID=A0A2S8SQA2_9BACT|nr:biotin/lipoyl-containing protein [Abditibacterium utsteinense]PQV62981.1 Biotin-requiring enzyme [Abditibacterium utsteinense]
MFRVTLPQLFENMEEATIGSWLVSAGAAIEVGAPLCELITEKTTLELPAENSGTLRHIFAPAKSVVPAGFVLALIGDASEEVDFAAIEAANAALSTKNQATDGIETTGLNVPSMLAEKAAPSTESSRIRATPAARRAAKVAGVSLEEVAAKFPGKVIGEDDIKAFSS